MKKQYEYGSLELKCYFEPVELARKLTAAEKNGWELVQVIPMQGMAGTGSVICLLKRELPEEGK